MFTKLEKLEFPSERFTKDRGLGWPGKGDFMPTNLMALSIALSNHACGSLVRCQVAVTNRQGSYLA